MKYNGIIESKLRILETKIKEIESWNIRSFDMLKQSTLMQNAVERALQVSVEVMIDISERILALHHVAPLGSAAANIEELQSMGIIQNRPEYTEMVRFRNFIVHRYEKIDLEIIYAILKTKLSFFHDFIAEIRKA